MDFYQGKVLRIDLSAGTSAVEPLNMEWVEKYIGGKGLLLRYMWEDIPPGLDPWAADNPVYLVTGPFAGTNVSTSSRLIVGCKSPVTGVLNDSYVGGSFAPEMKFAGYDMIIITGRAPQPTVVTIKDDVVEFRPAEPKYWGMKTSEIEQALRDDFDPDAKVLSIGPAGEKKLPWACVSTDQYHKAGRGGHGALMGDKNLKAIAIRGTGRVSVGDAKEFLADVWRMHDEYVLTDDNYWVHEEGTPILVDLVNGAGALPTRNWSEGEFEGAGSINSEVVPEDPPQEARLLPVLHRVPQLPRGGAGRRDGAGGGSRVRDHRPLRRQLRHRRHRRARQVQRVVRRVGNGHHLDRLRPRPRHGPHREGHQGLRRALRRRRELPQGAGAHGDPRPVSATSSLSAPSIWPRSTAHPELAMEVKNLELPGYDPRGTFGMSLSYSTSDRGGCHMRSYPVGDEIITGDEPADTMEGKAAYNINGQNFSSMKYLGIWCDFWAIDLDQMSQLFKHVWKREVTEDELTRPASASGTSVASSTCARASSRRRLPAGTAARREAFTRRVPSVGK